MNTTTLIIDEKVTIWRRSEVIVNVTELEKAKAENKLKEFISLCSWDYRDSELLTETEESLLPIENDNQATIEVYNDSTLNEIIYSNAIQNR
jgi:hypothetical protein